MDEVEVFDVLEGTLTVRKRRARRVSPTPIAAGTRASSVVEVRIGTQWPQTARTLAPVPVTATSSTTAPAVDVSPLLYPPDGAMTYVAPNSDSRPTYLGTIADSTWGCEIRRITNTNMHRNQYSTVQPWSATDAYIYLGYGNRLLDGSTYADMGSRGPFHLWLWSHTDDDVAYGIRGSNQTHFGKHLVGANSTSTLRDFSATYSALWPGGYDTNISADDHRVAIYGRRSVGGTYDVIVYDPVDDAVDATFNVGAGEPEHTKMSWSGSYVIVGHSTANGSGSGTYQGVKAYTIGGGTLSLARHLNNNWPHSDVALNAASQDVWVSTGLNSIRLSDGASTSLGSWSTPPNVPSFSYGHVSGQAFNRPGWLGFSGGIHYGNPTLVGSDQVGLVSLDGATTTETFCFAHTFKTSTAWQYNSSPFFVPNRNGTLGMFGSDWNDVPDANIYSYVVGVTT